MAGSFASLALDLRARTVGFNTDLTRAQRIADKRARQIERSLKRATRSFAVGLGAGLGIAAFTRGMGAATNAAKEFGTAMAEVSTLMGDTSGLAEMTDQTRELAKAFGTDHVLQAKARYQVLSGGVTDAAKQMEVLVAANTLAVGGLATVEEATRGLLSVMNAYGDRAGNAADVADKFFIAMKQGITSIPEIVQSIGGVAGIASQTGVSFNELLATFAAGTRVSKGAAQTMDALRGVIAAVAKSSTQANNEMEKLNQLAGTEIEFNIQGLQDAGGLFNFITQLKDVVNEFGDAGSISQLFGRVEAMNLVFQSMGEGYEQIAQNIQMLEDSAGQGKEALMKILLTPQKQLDIANAKWKDLQITIGSELMPVLVNAATEFGNVADAVGEGGTAFSLFTDMLRPVMGGLVLIVGLAKVTGKAVLGIGIGIVGTFRAIMAPVTAAVQTLMETYDALSNGDFAGAYDALGSTISKSGAEFDKALVQLNNAMAFVADEGGSDLEATLQSVANIMEGYKVTIPEIVSEMKSIPSAIKTISSSVGKELTKVPEELVKEVNKIAKGLLTDLESAEMEYAASAVAIEIYRNALEAAGESTKSATDLQNRLTEAWKKQREELVGGNVRAIMDGLVSPLEAAKSRYREATRAINDYYTQLDEDGSSVQPAIDAQNKLNAAYRDQVSDLLGLKDAMDAVATFGMTDDQKAQFNLLDMGGTEDQLALLRLMQDEKRFLQEIATADEALMERRNSLQEEYAGLLESTRTPVEAHHDQMARVDEMYMLGIIPSAEQYLELLERINDRFEESGGGKMSEWEEFAVQGARNLQTAFADFLFDPFEEGLDGMIRNFGKMIQKLLAEAAAAAALQALFGAMSGSSIGWVSSLGNSLAGARAEGGPVMAGQSYLVGENGPEVVVPSRSGTVVPNHALGGMGGGVTVNVDARETDNPGRLLALVPVIQSQVEAGMKMKMQRGYL